MSELFMAVAGILILISILFLFINATRNQNRKKEAFDKYFQQLVQQYNLTIDSKEVHRHLLLALDNSGKKLLYIRNPNENPEEKLIDLNQVKGSKLTETAQTFYMDDEKKRKDTLTTKIGIEVFYLKSEEPFLIEFYDYIINGFNQISEMRSKASCWDRKIKEVISKQKAG